MSILQRSLKRGIIRSSLGNDCQGLERTPVDYAFKRPHGWQRNPHYKVNPSDYYQPLNYGPIDFHSDQRRLQNGDMFKQYGQNWNGCGRRLHTLANDEKNRFDLTNVGSVGVRREMDDQYNPRMGPRGMMNTELRYVHPSDRDRVYFNKSYDTRLAD